MPSHPRQPHTAHPGQAPVQKPPRPHHIVPASPDMSLWRIMLLCLSHPILTRVPQPPTRQHSESSPIVAGYTPTRILPVSYPLQKPSLLTLMSLIFRHLLHLLTFPGLQNLLICLPSIHIKVCHGVAHLNHFHIFPVPF